MPAGRRYRGSAPDPEFLRLFTDLFQRSGLKQGAFGALFGVRQSYVSQILRAEANPTREVVDRMVEGLGLREAERERLLNAWERSQPPPGPPDERLEIATLAAEEALRRFAVVAERAPSYPADPEYDGRTYWEAYDRALKTEFPGEPLPLELAGSEVKRDTPKERLDQRYENIRNWLLAERAERDTAVTKM